MFELHSVLVMMANTEYSMNQDREALMMRLTEAESLLKESSRILSYECPRSEYGHLVMAAQDSRAQLECYINQVKHSY